MTSVLYWHMILKWKMKGLLMKSKIILLCTVLLLSYTNIKSSLFHIAIPEKLVEQQATLLLYMLDADGNQSVGKCQLDSSCRSRSILQEELEMTSCADADLMSTSIDLLDNHIENQQAVVVCFELDGAVQVVRILVIKDCLLDNDPFDVVSLSFNALDFDGLSTEMMEEDELSSLVTAIAEQSADSMSTRCHSSSSFLEQYLLYAKIFMLMQYGKAQRVVRGVSSLWQ